MIIKGNKYRFSLLTERLIRMEYSDKGIFVDEVTQVVTNRNFPKFEYRVVENDDELIIITSYLRVIYNKKEFSAEGLKVYVSGDYGSSSAVWHYGDKQITLGGTARTLDGVNGEIALEDGIISRQQWAVLDDSNSMLINSDNWFEFRKDSNSIDLYFFGYGLEYRLALRDFYTLTGKVPLLPRYALGNWWSRYYKYSDETYLNLMNRFEEEKIPFSVAVIDIDWHLTKVDPKYGTGWTGYTWNRKLFKEPRKFLETLHSKGLKVTLNVHPADGVRAYEDKYRDFAKFMGVDIENGDPIVFNITDKKFVDGYFKYVHHKLEEEGVDFWWIDWQQGNNSGIKGLDPLWLLNYFHYKDISRNNKRALILSRYAGAGSHRYPVGFSGDTVISWESLKFQPYFTSTASNIGYAWWSHDIGGHMNGIKDDELFVRWVQLGTFSPILRLHSTENEFNGKEPWNYNLIAKNISIEFLRLRHKLIPYLYTMNYITHLEKTPLILPVYYDNPRIDKAYEVRNEYYFGTNLLVLPITSKTDSKSKMSVENAYLPKGEWIDIFTGLKYFGDREFEFYRTLESIPVLARAGSILVLNANIERDKISNPNELDIKIFCGANASFTLYEDEKELVDYVEEDIAFTKYEYSEDDKTMQFTINPASGNLSAIPKLRSYKLEFYQNIYYESIDITLDDNVLDKNVYIDEKKGTLNVDLGEIDVSSKLVVNVVLASKNHRNKKLIENLQARIFDILNAYQIEYDLKTKIMAVIRKIDVKGRHFVLGELLSLGLEKNIYAPLVEILTAE